ncbi:MAG: cation:dicarboxylate symporter family transporter [Synechococcus sp.]
MLSSSLELLRRARAPRSFFLFILPVSIVLGTILPESAAPALNGAGMALVQLIAFPAIPLVLSAVMISIANIFSIHSEDETGRFRFAKRFFVAIVLVISFAALLSILLSIYQSPGVLSPDGKLSIGRFMLDSTDIHLSSAAPLADLVGSQFWLETLMPKNLLGDASRGQTLRVITGSVLAGVAMARLNPSITKPLIGLLRSVNSTSVQVLNIVLNLAPLVLILLISGAVSSINAEIVVALLNFTICVFLTAVASLGVSRLIFRRFTSSRERATLEENPIDSVFLLAFSTGSSMSSYSLMFESMKGMGRNESEVEASASLSLLIAQIGNVTYNVIAIMFALNLYNIPLTLTTLFSVVALGIVTGLASAGLDSVAVTSAITPALLFFQVPAETVLVLLIAIDPILTLPRAATTSALAMAITVVASQRDQSAEQLTESPSV